MRKSNWLVGSIALGIGLVIGIVGYALAITPVDGDSQLVNFWGNKQAQTVTGSLQDSSPTTASDALNPTPETNSSSSIDPNGLDNTTTEGLPGSASGEGTSIPSGVTGSASSPNSNGVPTELAQSIIADYKQDIGLFFEAWKSTEMISFRSKLMKAYTGDLYEKHARQAEPFIAQGIGMDISDIRFEEVTVESATANAATLTATYQYVAQDYDLGEQAPIGEKKEHQVKVRANLIKDSSRWLITGETLIK
jgi:hypothetical protein